MNTAPMQSPPFKHVSIIGLGLIGGSLAMAIKSRYPDSLIHGIDPHAETLQYALKSDIVDEVSLVLPETFADNHLIIIASHLKHSMGILRKLSERTRPEQDLLISDIGSCKRAICVLGDKLLPQQFIGGHPMAGREKSGIHYATSLLFNEKKYLLCPSKEINPDRLARFETLLKAIGANLRHIDPDQHDRIMAYVSHFPQLYATLLGGLIKQNNPTQLLTYQGAGMDDQMRLAGSSHAMWADIFDMNRDNLAMALGQFSTLLNQAKEQLERGEGNFEMLFTEANQMYQTWQEFKQTPATDSKIC